MAADKTICTIQYRYRLTDSWQQIDEVEAFDYVSDVLAVGEESHVTVVNEKRKYNGSLLEGGQIRIFLSNSRVNGGDPTLKFLGRIIDRDQDPRAGTIQLTCADLGWHLRECDAPLWYTLRKGNLLQLCDPEEHRIGRNGAKYHFLDPSWGLSGPPRLTNAPSRITRLGLKQTIATQRALAQSAGLTVIHVQVEPGDKVLDKIVEYARRLNLLVNVGVDGVVSLFRPDYSQDVLYRIRSGNEDGNVSQQTLHTSVRTIWSVVECVGEQIGVVPGQVGTQDDPNVGKKRGSLYNEKALPFLHRKTFQDGEMYEKKYAKQQARWMYERGVFDALSISLKMPDHHLNGVWWESDTMANLNSPELGARGDFYVSRVRCEGNRRSGDSTTIDLKLPGLMQASFGILPTPRFDTEAAQTTEDAHATKVVKK